MNKVRATLEEVQVQIASVQAELDSLQSKAESGEGLSPEETSRYEELVTQLEQLKQDEAQLAAESRYNAIKHKETQPQRSAPKVWAQAKGESKRMTHDEAKLLWLRGRFKPESLTSDDIYRARSAGFNILGNTLEFKVDYNGINYKNAAFKKRTKLATVNAGAGQEWLYTSYDDKVVEYLTYESTFLSTLSVSTISGYDHVIFKVDNSGLESNYTSDSGGSELNPTIPERNLVSAKVTVRPQTITSGIHKVTWEELQDSYVDIPAQISKVNGLMHKRKMEREILNATGNGTTGVQGLLDVAQASGASGGFTEANIRAAIHAIPLAYRKNVIIVANDSVAADIYANAVDDFGRSLFDRNIEMDSEFETLAGKKFFVSEYMPDDTMLVFNPEYYRLVVGNVETFQFFEERYFPDSAWSGLMRFGGVWAGPDDAIQVVTATS